MKTYYDKLTLDKIDRAYNLLVEAYQATKFLKDFFVKHQLYDTAVVCRDTERSLELLTEIL